MRVCGLKEDKGTGNILAKFLCCGSLLSHIAKKRAMLAQKFSKECERLVSFSPSAVF